jgi:hypothetical protein
MNTSSSLNLQNTRSFIAYQVAADDRSRLVSCKSQLSFNARLYSV